MKLLVAILHNDDVHAVLDTLNGHGVAFTRLSTTGGFLRAGNATLLIGADEARLPEIYGIFEENCSTRKELIDVGTAPFLGTLLHAPVEVTVGGATIFLLDVEQFRKI
jgi:uncharacterized protein YaaQ